MAKRINVGTVSVTLMFFVMFYLETGLCSKSRLDLTEGVYENLTVAFNGNDAGAEARCGEIISSIKDSFTFASDYLSKATDGRARFGKIRVLLPESWNPSNCFIPGVNASSPSVRAFENYWAADFRISSAHAIAKTLPWTDQHGGCGHQGHTIFLPASFMMSKEFVAEEKASVILHEWMKYRYGVFEEHGYFGDQYYDACYTREGSRYFTSCMSPTMVPMEDGLVSAKACKTVVQDKELDLKTWIKNAEVRSVMFAPHLIPTINSTCTKDYHNLAINTKHSVECDRKTTNDIMLAHEDFADLKATTSFNEKVLQEFEPVIELVQAAISKEPAYAFVIDDTYTWTPQQSKVLIQSLAELLYFVDDGTLLYFLPYNQPASELFLTISSESSKQRFLDRIQQALQVQVSMSNSTRPNMEKATYAELQAKLNNYQRSSWHVFQFASTPANDDELVRDLKSMEFTLSLITFNDMVENWLLWNSAPQTRDVLVLPSCDRGDSLARTECDMKLSNRLSDYLFQVLGDQQSKRYFQRIADVAANTSSEIEVEMPSYGSELKTFLLSFSLEAPEAVVKVFTPNGNCTGIQNLLSVPGLKFVDINAPNCKYEPGPWKISVISSVAGTFGVRGHVEVSGSDTGLLIYPSYGFNLEKSFSPYQMRMLVPIHIAVRTPAEYPVIDAEVKAEILFMNSSGLQSTEFDLKDNGAYPDTMAGDGVYSGLVRGFSATPSFHISTIEVKTGQNARVLQQFDSERFSAALLDTRMSSKCCGSVVPVYSTSALQSSSYTMLLPSFRTNTSVPNPNALPPSEISHFDEILDGTLLVLILTAPDPGDGENAIASYRICDTCSNYCVNVDAEDCPPQKPNTRHNCTINKAKLELEPAIVACFGTESRSTPLSLSFTIEGENKAGMPGRRSKQTFELMVEDADAESESTCKSVSDGCLPIWVFWTLIGCLGFVLLLVLILGICLCVRHCGCCKRRSEPKTTFISEPYPAPGKATDGGITFEPALERRGTDMGNGTRSILRSRETKDHRLPSNEGEINKGFGSISGPSLRSSMPPQNHGEDSDNMPVYFYNAGQDAQRRRSKYDLGEAREGKKVPPRGSLGHAQPYNFNNYRTEPGYFSSRNERNGGPDMDYTRGNFSSRAGNMDDQLSDASSREPMYATVNRNIRRNQVPRQLEGNSGLKFGSVNSSRPVSTFIPPSNNPAMTRPLSGLSNDSGFVHGQTPTKTSRPVRMDHFPSSESETYSEMSRLESLPPGPPPPPPPPPPLPSTFGTNPRPKNSSARPKDDDTQSENSIVETGNSSRSFARSPPSQGGFSILAQMGTIPDRKVLLKPRQGPPPPPPPRSSGRRFDPSYLTGLKTGEEKRTQDKKEPKSIDEQDRYGDSDDNDSDNWDLYDDFQFEPGVSHV